MLGDDYSEGLGLPIDSVRDKTDSDDGDNGDFVEVEAFQRVVGGRTTNSSRSASVSSGSWTPPTPITPISSVFQALSSDFSVPVAPNSLDFRRGSPDMSDNPIEVESTRREFIERSLRREFDWTK